MASALERFPTTADAPGPGYDRWAVDAEGLVKVYGRGETEVRALDGVDLATERGRFTAVMGPSGSGKSTLLHCLAGLERLTGGHVWIGGVDLTALDDRHLTRLRRDHIGFIFQTFNLVPTLTAAENITLPMDIAGRRVDRAWLANVVDVLGLGPRLGHRPTELSGGQQQRVAAARALVSRPDIIFADEPSGNLDSRNSGELLGFLRRAVSNYGQTIVMVTHDAVAAAISDRVVFLADGRVVRDLEEPTVDTVLEVTRSLGA